MNYDDDKKLENVTPYRATGNLNTAISNPSIDINDTMDVNIKSVNTVQNNQVNTTNSIPLTNNQNTMNQNSVNMQNQYNNIYETNSQNTTNNQNVNNTNVKKTYVTTVTNIKKEVRFKSY